ncbi:MAG: AAA domain-containing protein [Lachnospiraceae bacterium]|nr:AAA domain-containing protein [Lachnospiraceae bacterium]
MNIKRTKEEIKNTIEAYLLRDEYGEYEIPVIRQRPILLLGSPGIGKTQIMEQISKECGIGLVAYTITHHTRQSAIGLPFISRKKYGGQEVAVTEYTMSEIVAAIYDKMEQTGLSEGILFLDEINCVSETLAPAMLQFLQCKSFGNHKIPQGWVIVAAGNPPEYNKSVREFDVVTMDRVKKIEVEADFTVWKEYAYRQGLHGAVISYLNTKKQSFYQMETTVDGRNFATPRGWEDLSNLIKIYEKLGKTVDREVVVQYIQYPKIAKDFANYLELYYKYRTDYQIEEILRGRLDEILLKKVAHASFDERLSVLGLLISKVNEALKSSVQTERYMEMIFAMLSGYKESVKDEMQELNGQQLLQNVISKFNLDYKNRKKAELIRQEEEKIYLRVIAFLERLLQMLKLEDIRDKGEAFERVKELFEQEREAFEIGQRETLQIVEYVFDFLEGAFGNSQEMVIFITELNSNPYSVSFLQACECERYYRYNKELLFDEKRKRLLERMNL